MMGCDYGKEREKILDRKTINAIETVLRRVILREEESVQFGGNPYGVAARLCNDDGLLYATDISTMHKRDQWLVTSLTPKGMRLADEVWQAGVTTIDGSGAARVIYRHFTETPDNDIGGHHTMHHGWVGAIMACLSDR